jgi:hypothetical protein
MYSCLLIRMLAAVLTGSAVGQLLIDQRPRSGRLPSGLPTPHYRTGVAGQWLDETSGSGAHDRRLGAIRQADYQVGYGSTESCCHAAGRCYYSHPRDDDVRASGGSHAGDPSRRPSRVLPGRRPAFGAIGVGVDARDLHGADELRRR